MSVREAVARYLARGFRPMPMHGVDELGRCLCGGIDPRTGKPCNPGKHSRDEDSWKNGRVYGPEDFSERDNVALALGPWQPDRWLVCLDFDLDGAAPTLLPLVAELPRTMTQRSPRGCHLFFTVRPFEPLGNWVDAFQTKYLAGWACDIRYARGRINVAPSRSAHGAYQWTDERDPVELPLQFIDRVLSERKRRGLPVLSRWDRGSKRA